VPELSHIDPRSAALLVMDYQVDVLTKFMTAAQSADAIACVPELIAAAREVGMMVIHVVVAFRPGHPEVSPRNSGFSAVKANGMLAAGSEGAAIHPGGIHQRARSAGVVGRDVHRFRPGRYQYLRCAGDAMFHHPPRVLANCVVDLRRRNAVTVL
jgi:hypothetical protein